MNYTFNHSANIDYYYYLQFLTIFLFKVHFKCTKIKTFFFTFCEYKYHKLAFYFTSVTSHQPDETGQSVRPEEVEGDAEWHQNGAENRETLEPSEEDRADEPEKNNSEDTSAEQR